MVRVTLSLTLLCVAFYGAHAQQASPSPTTSAPPAQITAGNCFYPGANPAGAYGDRPCDPDAEVSLCCPLGWTCLSNKICQVTDGSLALQAVGTIQRGTCTDPRWNDTVCGDFCLNPRDTDRDGQLLPCGNNVFVCAGDANEGTANCDSGVNVFTLAEGAPQTIISVPSGTSTLASSAASPTGSSTLGTSVRSSSSAVGSAGSSGTPVPTEGGNSHRTRDLAIGVTIGVVGLILLIALVWWLLRRRNKNKNADVLDDKAGSADQVNHDVHKGLPPSDMRPPGTTHRYEPVPERYDPGRPVSPMRPTDGVTDYTRYNDGADEIPDAGPVGGAATTAATAAAATATAKRSVRPERNLAALDPADLDFTIGGGRALVGDPSSTRAPREGVTLTDPPRGGDSFPPERLVPPGR